MKSIFLTALCALVANFASAKQSSSAVISKIESITISEDAITIVGDAAFSSQMATTQESAHFATTPYKAYGRLVKFVIKPYPTFPEQWAKDTERAKLLKKGDSVTIFFQNETAQFLRGVIASVEGTGGIKDPEKP